MDPLGIVLVTIVAVFIAYRSWCWLSDWAYDGPEPDAMTSTGQTHTDANGKLWWYAHDNVGWAGWVPGHLGARIIRRHENALRKASSV